MQFCYPKAHVLKVAEISTLLTGITKNLTELHLLPFTVRRY